MPLLKPRTFYKPFEYDFAFDAYLAQNQAHWLPTSIPMSNDVTDYQSKLTPQERNTITQVLRFFVQGDVEVANNYASRLGPMFPVPEINMMLMAFGNMEAVHVHAYSYLIDTLGLPESEYSTFMDYASMRDKYEYLHGFKCETPADLARTLAVFGAFMEGTALFASFAILLNFRRQGIMKGLGQIIEWSVRDESLHAAAISQLYNVFAQENPDVVTPDFREGIRQACRDMVEMEDRFVDTCFEMGGIRGLQPEDVKEYVRYTADRRLKGIGLEPVFNAAKNPLPWVTAALNGKEFTNFFENTSTSYAKGMVDDSWPVLGEHP